MAEKIVKLAVIRDNDSKACPFGLMIPDACNIAGDLVDQMTPVLNVGKDGFDVLVFRNHEELEEVVSSNMSVLTWSDEEPHACKYANYVFDRREKTECNYGDEGSGLGHVDFAAFPAYTQYFSQGYASVPIGFYSEHPVRSQIGTLESLVSGSFASAGEKEEIVKKP